MMVRESQLGFVKFPTEWKNNPNLPNHQPGNDLQILDLPKRYVSLLECVLLVGG